MIRIVYCLLATPMLGNIIANLLGLELPKNMTISWISPTIYADLSEIFILILFFYRNTRNIGFFLICSYLGGAIAIAYKEERSIFLALFLLFGYWGLMFFQNQGVFHYLRTSKVLLGVVLKK